MTKAKAANYTAEMEATLRAGYTGADNKAEVNALAAAIGKTPASVRAKLSTMGIYQKAEATSTAKSGDNKMQLAERIGAVAGLKDFEVEGLAKATKGALEKVLNSLTNS